MSTNRRSDPLEFAWDSTQIEILQHLKNTRELLGKVASLVSDRVCHAEIRPLPDLGLPNNVTRAHGGFFTGALYSWESDQPFIPIDATVNICGVSCFKVNIGLPTLDEFKLMIFRCRERLASQEEFRWNFESGNHFISICQNDNQDLFLVLHSSACEFKDQPWGLYPNTNNWYHKHIRYMELEHLPSRYLRYISGKQADLFFELVQKIAPYAEWRHQRIAEFIFGAGKVEDLLWREHYGMPTINDVAIGCQIIKEGELGFLLSRHGEDLFIFRADTPKNNSLPALGISQGIFPHGFGSHLPGGCTIDYQSDHLIVGGRKIGPKDSFSAIGAETRGAGRAALNIANEILKSCPGIIVQRLSPLLSYSKSGFAEFANVK